MPIHFFLEETGFYLRNKRKLKSWILQSILQEGFTIGSLNFIFCSDVYLLDINKKFLNHHYFTDIITFDNSEEARQIDADIYISIDRVRENAAQLNTTFYHELYRVIIHGVLHLLGWNDKRKNEKQAMRSQEDKLLKLLFHVEQLSK